MDKEKLRKLMLDKRNQLLPADINDVSGLVLDHICQWPAYCAASTIFLYLSLAGEPQLDRLIKQAWHDGKIVCAPRLLPQYGYMEAAILTDLKDIQLGKFNLRIPDAHCKRLDAGDIDLAFIPGLAFDRKGNRLGFGAGYYDRFLPLAGRALLVGVAWDFQLVSDLPVEAHDVSMNYLLTQHGVACV